MTAKEFQEWLQSLDDDSSSDVMTFVNWLLLADGLPNISVEYLRSLVAGCFESKDKIWQQYLEWMAEK